MTTRVLEALSVPLDDPRKIIPQLIQALDGEACYAPHAPGTKLPYQVGTTIDDTTLVMSTSGSTGTPKGAMLSAENLRYSCRSTIDFLGGAGRWVLALPAFHIAGMQVLLRSILSDTEPVVLDLTRARGQDFIPAFVEATHKASSGTKRLYTSLTPMLLDRVMATLSGIEALRQYTKILLGGGPIPNDLLDAAKRLNIRVVTTYGASETSGGLFYSGLPIGDARYELDEDGRISVGGSMVGSGYINVPSDPFYKPHWFRTSDLGCVEDGRLRIIGRVDNLINTGGLKVAPEPIESRLKKLKGVTDICVIGIPDPSLGQRIIALYTGRMEPQQLEAELDDLPKWQRPKSFTRLSVLPYLSNGKIDRRRLIDTYSK